MGTWDEWKRNETDAPGYVNFDQHGDKAEGVITKIGKQTWPGGDTSPVLTLRTKDGIERILTVSGHDLLRQVVDIGPGVGDYISVEYVDDKDVGKPSKMKLYKVAVQKQEQAAVFASAPPPPPPVVGALPAVPGYPPPTAEQLADPAYKAWYDQHAPKAPPPPDSPDSSSGDEPF